MVSAQTEHVSSRKNKEYEVSFGIRVPPNLSCGRVENSEFPVWEPTPEEPLSEEEKRQM